MTTQNNDWDSSLEQQFKESTYALICSVCHGGGESEPQITCEKCGGHGLTDWNIKLLKQFIQTLLTQAKQDTVKEVIGKIEENKKKTSKVVSKKFWYDPEKNPKGEFEQYGEYEEFFVFSKKMRNQALNNLINQLRSEYGIKDE